MDRTLSEKNGLGDVALLSERPTAMTALAAALIFVFLSSRTRGLVAATAVEVETPGKVL